jgi:hypothetical protein
MKKHLLSFKVEKPKHRAHFMLFCEDTPFKPKVVASRVKYKRKPKHPGKDME